MKIEAMSNIYIRALQEGANRLENNEGISYNELKEFLLPGNPILQQLRFEYLFRVWYFQSFMEYQSEFIALGNEMMTMLEWARDGKRLDVQMYLKSDSYFKLLQHNELEQIRQDSERARNEALKSIRYAQRAFQISIAALIIYGLFSVLGLICK